jgi:hypothetical protein
VSIRAAITAEFFPLLGVPPLLGRGFEPARMALPAACRRDQLATMAAALSGDSGVIGTTVNLSGTPMVVVG